MQSLRTRAVPTVPTRCQEGQEREPKPPAPASPALRIPFPALAEGGGRGQTGSRGVMKGSGRGQRACRGLSTEQKNM